MSPLNNLNRDRIFFSFFFFLSVSLTQNSDTSHVFVFVMLSILQSQFIEKGFKKAENYEQNVVLLLFLFTLDQNNDNGKQNKVCNPTWKNTSYSVPKYYKSLRLSVYYKYYMLTLFALSGNN